MKNEKHNCTCTNETEQKEKTCCRHIDACHSDGCHGGHCSGGHCRGEEEHPAAPHTCSCSDCADDDDGACGCSCGCGHEHGEGEEEHSLPVILAGGVLLALCILLQRFTNFPWFVYLICYLIPYLLVGWKTILESAEHLLRGAVFDENFLMSLASVGAFCVGEYAEGVVVMLLFSLGEWLEDVAVGRTRSSVRSLMEIRPDTARIICEEDGDSEEVPVEAVGIGACIEVHPGERIPLDGEVTSGTANLDTAALTGESVPRPVVPGDNAAAGCISTDGVLRIRVTKTAGESTVQKILDLAEHASSKKTRTEAFITRFARVYTPLVVCAAVLLAVIPSLVTGEWSVWIHRALTFLVVSCPCALVISVPLSFFCGIGGASKKGILIKGSRAIEALSKTAVVATDKTGTLTRGEFRVTAILAEDGDEASLLALAAEAEQYSSHPAARGILREYQMRTPDAAITPFKADNSAELSGRGVRCVSDGKTVLCGNALLMTENGINVNASHINPAVCTVYLASDGKYLGALWLEDTVKDDAADAVRAFRCAGVKEIHMLTGDTPGAAQPVADALGLDGCHASLLPDEKMETAELLKAKAGDGTLLCLGDGINDAPLLAMADIGCAMGALGSDAAMEAADVVIMNDSPAKAAEAIRISRRTMRIARQNIVIALGIKGIILILGAIGVTGMGAAVFGDVGVCMLCICNAARLNGK